MCGTNFGSYLKLGSAMFRARSGGGSGCPGENRLEFEVPEALTPGTYIMSMENAGGIWTSPQTFTVTAP